MTTYPEVCDACGHRFDDQRPMARCDDHPPCPRCGGATRRDWSSGGAPPLIFKGDGWYCSRPHVEVTEPGTVLEDGTTVGQREVNLLPGQRSC